MVWFDVVNLSIFVYNLIWISKVIKERPGWEISKNSSPKTDKKSLIKTQPITMPTPSTTKQKNIKNSIQNKGIHPHTQETNRQESTTTSRTTSSGWRPPSQTPLQSSRTSPIIQIKDKDDIARLLLEKMPEIDRQL